MYDLYLSGPMTGLPELNYPAFEKACLFLRGSGLRVYSPHEWEETNNGGRFDLALAFTDYARVICREAGGVALLDGWENSPGARAEAALAHAVRKPVYTFGALPLKAIDMEAMAKPAKPKFGWVR